MLVTPQSNRRNLTEAWVIAGSLTLVSLALSWWSIAWLLLVPAAALTFVLWRRETLRRRKVVQQPFPESIERTLKSRVRYFQSLDETQKSRFRKMVQVFLDEVAITGIRTEVDDTTRALVAASAVIPVFGLDDWEYSGLGEVLIYPGSYDENYQTDSKGNRNILGMIGVGHLSGVMILSKPDLINGFEVDGDKRNVGIHEFSHLVDKADGTVDGIPATIPRDVVTPWVQWVGHELANVSGNQKHIDDYAFTNPAEYFAVLSEYFFDSPHQLERKEPRLYAMLQKIYRQNTRAMFRGRPLKRRRLGRNAACPCGSGQKYKRCCRNAT